MTEPGSRPGLPDRARAVIVGGGVTGCSIGYHLSRLEQKTGHSTGFRAARNVRRSVLHDRIAAAGAPFGVPAGWEFAEWHDPQAPERAAPDYRRPAAHEITGGEHRAVREAAGLLDMSLMDDPQRLRILS